MDGYSYEKGRLDHDAYAAWQRETVERIFREWCRQVGLPDNIPIVVSNEEHELGEGIGHAEMVDAATCVTWTPGVIKRTGETINGYVGRVIQEAAAGLEADTPAVVRKGGE